MIQTGSTWFSAAGLAGLVVAVSLAAPVQADDLPTDTDTNTITRLSSQAATVLAGTTLSPEAATALAEYKGGLGFLETLPTKFAAHHPLAPDNAWAHAAVFRGRLSAITAFDSPDSVAVAKALAALKGPLALPNLEKISPQTLAALIKKEDVEIPLIETLEIIPEPDGSPTDDFVIPKDFKERQRQQRAQ